MVVQKKIKQDSFLKLPFHECAAVAFEICNSGQKYGANETSQEEEKGVERETENMLGEGSEAPLQW